MPAESGPRSAWSFGAAAIAGFSLVAEAGVSRGLLLAQPVAGEQKRGGAPSTTSTSRARRRGYVVIPRGGGGTRSFVMASSG
jgi:hypothetical protein